MHVMMSYSDLSHLIPNFSIGFAAGQVWVNTFHDITLNEFTYLCPGSMVWLAFYGKGALKNPFTNMD